MTAMLDKGCFSSADTCSLLASECYQGCAVLLTQTVLKNVPALTEVSKHDGFCSAVSCSQLAHDFCQI